MYCIVIDSIMCILGQCEFYEKDSVICITKGQCEMYCKYNVRHIAGTV